MDSENFEDLRAHFIEKLSSLCEGLAILSCMEIEEDDLEMNACQSVQLLRQEVEELSTVLTLIKNKCAEQRKVLADIEALKEKLGKLTKSVEYTQSNIPTHVPATSAVPPRVSGTTTSEAVEDQSAYIPEGFQTVAFNHTTFTQATAKNNRKQSSSPCPLIEYLTVDEFDSVPKYMKGRLTYQQVNNAVDELNKAFMAKYKLLRHKRSALSPVQLNRYNECKSQESEDTKGVYFIVEKDIKEWSCLKISKETHKFFTILRHCGRLNELRGGGFVRYALTGIY